MIVADTGGILALLDSDDRYHSVVRELYEKSTRQWILPWAILPEVDYLAGTRLGDQVARSFVEDIRNGYFAVDSNATRDIRLPT